MSVNLSLARVMLHARGKGVFVREDDLHRMVDVFDPDADNHRLMQLFYVGKDGKPAKEPGPIMGCLICLPNDPTHKEQCGRFFDVERPSDIDPIIEWLVEQIERLASTG